MEFNKTTCKEVSNITKETLADALKHLGVTVQQCSGRYSPLEFTMKVVLATTTEDGETQVMKDYRTYATMYDLPQDMLGSRFLYGGKLIEVVGFLPTRPKNDIEFKNISTGKCYIAPHATVKRAYELAMKRKVAVGV